MRYENLICDYSEKNNPFFAKYDLVLKLVKFQDVEFLVSVRMIFVVLITGAIVMSVWHLWDIESSQFNKDNFCRQIALKYMDSSNLNVAYNSKKYNTSNVIVNAKENLANILSDTNCTEVLKNATTKFYTDSEFNNVLYLSVGMTSGLFTALFFLLKSLTNNRDENDNNSSQPTNAASVKSSKDDEYFSDKFRNEQRD